MYAGWRLRLTQRARDVAAVKTPAAVSSPKAAVADGSDNWETF
ncbi:TPA: chemotaxis protein [Salmonella enterica]|nr:chemotaxis protein [Salmonella enterica]